MMAELDSFAMRAMVQLKHAIQRDYEVVVSAPGQHWWVGVVVSTPGQHWWVGVVVSTPGQHWWVGVA